MEDMRHLATIADNDRELQELLVNYNQRANGLTEREALIALRLEQNEVMMEALKKQHRVLRYMRGDSVEPVVHPAEAVLVGVFGGGAA